MTIEEGVSILTNHLSQDMKAKALELLNKTDSIKRIINPLSPIGVKIKFYNYYYTSNSICYGDALEEILNKYIASKGGELLPKDTVPGKDCDCLFKIGDKVILIEMKVRDDHDSAKKVGQIHNFLEKIDYLKQHYNNVESCMWFVDPRFHKNYGYYIQYAPNVFYGQDIEQFLFNLFKDARCNGLYNLILDITSSYKLTNQGQMLDSLNIDYHLLSSMALRNLIVESNTYKEAVNFFLGEITTKQLLEYVYSLPKYPTAKEVINILEEYNNEL